MGNSVREDGMSDPDYDIDAVPICDSCRCRGNRECGRESSPDPSMECALDRAGVCPCCNAGLIDWRVEAEHKREAHDRQILLVEE